MPVGAGYDASTKIRAGAKTQEVVLILICSLRYLKFSISKNNNRVVFYFIYFPSEAMWFRIYSFDIPQ